MRVYMLALVTAVNVGLCIYVSIGWRALGLLLDVNLDVLLAVAFISVCDVLDRVRE